jgi:hypothetical protein
MLGSMVRLPVRLVFVRQPRVFHLIRCSAVLLGLVLACMPLAAEDRPAHLVVLDLYNRGEYTDCRSMVRRMIDDYVAGVIDVPARDMATVYLVAACLEDVFRDPDYAEAVDDNLKIALEMDPNVDTAPTESRAYVQARLAAVRAVVIGSQGPTGRRFSVGAVVAAEGSAGIHWRNQPLFGVRLGVGVLPWLSIEAGALLPIQGPPLDELELYLGGTFRPVFVLNRPMVVLNVFYAAVQQGSWSHGLSLGVGAEIAFRSGVALRASAELLRIEGTEAPEPESTDYPFFMLFGMPVTLSLPRLTLSVACTF